MIKINDYGMKQKNNQTNLKQKNFMIEFNSNSSSNKKIHKLESCHAVKFSIIMNVFSNYIIYPQEMPHKK